MSDWAVDALTGEAVVVVPDRQARPSLPDACPFCPGGVEAPDAYRTRWFTNRWPPLPDGRAEVLLYTPDHDASFADLDDDAVEAVVELWAERTAALGARTDVAYVLVFENRGPEVGATIAHPHGQVYAFAEVPPAPAAELAGACEVCVPDGEPVSTAGSWRAWVPHRWGWPYGMVLAPEAHLPDLPSVVDRASTGRLLRDCVRRLDALFDAPMPYMLWWHQRPTDGGDWPSAHVHGHIAPLLRDAGRQRFVAAGELGSGVAFNPLAPAAAAAALRAAR